MAYESFEKYRGPKNASIDNFFYKSRISHVAKLKEHLILLPDLVLIYRVLKSVNLIPENERLVKAAVSGFTLCEVEKLKKKKILHR